jgi:hypothetical protein
LLIIVHLQLNRADLSDVLSRIGSALHFTPMRDMSSA